MKVVLNSLTEPKRNIRREEHIGYLNSSFSKMDLLRELFSRVDVWILSLWEHALERFQLRAGEDGSDASLFASLLYASFITQKIAMNCKLNEILIEHTHKKSYTIDKYLACPTLNIWLMILLNKVSLATKSVQDQNTL